MLPCNHVKRMFVLDQVPFAYDGFERHSLKRLNALKPHGRGFDLRDRCAVQVLDEEFGCILAFVYGWDWA
ncbi:MAG: hypothetical protein AMXMBFR84_39450 [Candidatus Hydrogenedentota bacterium]